MSRRSGVTLIEVLVSIFVTAIGLLAILALFPVGAFSMANAIKNGRCVQASINATAFAKFQNIANDSSIVNTTSGVNLYTNPDATNLPSLPASYTGPSYPVYVDPVSTLNFSAPFSSWLGDVNFFGAFAYKTHIPRTSLNCFSSIAAGGSNIPFQRMMTLLDDINFGQAAGPAYPSPALLQVEREDRYTWTYMLQRPSANYAGLVNATIVVYAGRSAFLPGENTYVTNAAGTFQGVQFIAGSNQVDVTWNPLIGQPKPVIKNGTWILDATCVHYNQNTAKVEVPPDGPHGFFYRVVGVTEVPQTNTLTLELQTPIRGTSTVDLPPLVPALQPYGVLVVMENVVEVFEKRPL
jgi:hypothetical protein